LKTAGIAIAANGTFGLVSILKLIGNYLRLSAYPARKFKRQPAACASRAHRINITRLRSDDGTLGRGAGGPSEFVVDRYGVGIFHGK
jgi:hypothetical protein